MQELNKTDEAFILSLIERTRAISRRRMARILGAFTARELEDCEAELWLLLCTKAPALRVHENPDGWVFLAADHIAQSAFRRCAKEDNRTSDLDDEQFSSSDRAYSLEERVINDLLYAEWEREGYKERLLSQLKSRERELYELRYTEGLSFEEIGKKTGQSSAAVQMALSRIRKKIIAAIGKDV